MSPGMTQGYFNGGATNNISKQGSGLLKLFQSINQELAYEWAMLFSKMPLLARKFIKVAIYSRDQLKYQCLVSFVIYQKSSNFFIFFFFVVFLFLFLFFVFWGGGGYFQF